MRGLILGLISAGVVSAFSISDCLPSVNTPAASSEEFVGPFPSWKNVKTCYGAAGDGKTDDTAAIQKGLDDLQFHRESCVLYFPAGTYRITDTLRTVRNTHLDSMGITVVGEDPARTVIYWDGRAGGSMLQYSAWYSRISRLTLNGAGSADVCLAYGPGFSTYNETSDMVFQDAKTGLLLGTGPDGQAENAVLRCKFLRCSNAGIVTSNWNSMDIWAWYCRFEDCAYGMHNVMGNFHAYQCLFLRSRKADIKTDNLMVFSFVNNTSIDSACFLDFSGWHTWGSPASITGNRIIDPTSGSAIRLGNGGPYLLADNVIRSKSGTAQPAVYMTWGDQALVGNTYTVSDPVKQAGRFLRLGDKRADPNSIRADFPKMPPPPPNLNRRIFDVPAGATAAAIQEIIDGAAQLQGQRAVVHFPKGTYKIDRTIVIAGNSDVQLIGDGAAETATVLEWTGKEGGWVIRLEGPSRATLRDFSVHAGRSSAILVEDADQPGGRIYADQLSVSGSSGKPLTGLLVNGLERSDVELTNLQGGFNLQTWVKVYGGRKLRAGLPARGQVSIFAGATGGSTNALYAVAGGGQLLVRSVYHEKGGSDEAAQAILLNGSGSLSIDSTRFSYQNSAEVPLIRADSFRGNFALSTGLLLAVDSQQPARIDVTGDGSRCNLLCLGDLFWISDPGADADAVFRNQAAPPAKAGMALCNVNSMNRRVGKNGFAELKNKGVFDGNFILGMLRPLRKARVWLPQEANRRGATNLQIHRVICNGGKDTLGVELRAAK